MSLDTPDLTKASLGQPDENTVGGYLQANRLNNHMSLAQVSEITKYHASQLRLLEEQQWDKLPTGFVLRSIVKKFAVAVGANPELALEKLMQSTTGNEAPSMNKHHLKSSIGMQVNAKIDDGISEGGSGTWLWILLIIVVLGVVGYIALSQGMFSLDDIEFLKKWFN